MAGGAFANVSARARGCLGVESGEMDGKAVRAISSPETSDETRSERSRVRHRRRRLGPHLFCATPSRCLHRLSEVRARSALASVAEIYFQTAAARRWLLDARYRRGQTVELCAKVGDGLTG